MNSPFSSVPAKRNVDSRPIGRSETYTICMLFPGHTLTDHLGKGDGLVAYGFIAELARRGHRLHVIAQQVEIERPLPPNVTIYSVTRRSRGFIQRALFVARSRAIVRRILAKEKIDLVQQLNPVCNGMSFGLIGLRLPLILGTYVANWPAEKFAKSNLVMRAFAALKELAQHGVIRVQERLAAGFLVTTRAALDRFTSVADVAGRIYWLPHGIDIRMFSQARPVTNARKVLFLANVGEKKGIFTLLEAFETVFAALPDATLDIVGEGPALADVTRRVAKMTSARNIRLVGKVDRAMVPDLMANATLYCLPSFGEPYATTVIEAMACGKPIVVTNSGGLGEMVSDAGGRRVPAGDAAALAASLIEILRSAELQQQMGAHNREVAELQYDWPRVTDKLEAAYRSVLARCESV